MFAAFEVNRKESKRRHVGAFSRARSQSLERVPNRDSDEPSFGLGTRSLTCPRVQLDMQVVSGAGRWMEGPCCIASGKLVERVKGENVPPGLWSALGGVGDGHPYLWCMG